MTKQVFLVRPRSLFEIRQAVVDACAFFADLVGPFSTASVEGAWVDGSTTESRLRSAGWDLSPPHRVKPLPLDLSIGELIGRQQLPRAEKESLDELLQSGWNKFDRPSEITVSVFASSREMEHDNPIIRLTSTDVTLEVETAESRDGDATSISPDECQRVLTTVLEKHDISFKVEG